MDVNVSEFESLIAATEEFLRKAKEGEALFDSATPDKWGDALKGAFIDALPIHICAESDEVMDFVEYLFTSRVRDFEPGLEVVITRCVGAPHRHSCWAAGPVYLNRDAALAAGHTHSCECVCGRVDSPLER
jgi:hypothetical protein